MLANLFFVKNAILKEQAMITLQEMAVFNSLYGSLVAKLILNISYCKFPFFFFFLMHHTATHNIGLVIYVTSFSDISYCINCEKIH